MLTYKRINFSLLIFMSLLRYFIYNIECLYTNVFFLLFAHLFFTLSPSLHYIPSLYSALLHSSLFYSNSIFPLQSSLLYSTLRLFYSALVCSSSRYFILPITSYLTLLFSVHLASTPFLPTPPPSGPLTLIKLTILPSIPSALVFFPPLLHSIPVHCFLLVFN